MMKTKIKLVHVFILVSIEQKKGDCYFLCFSPAFMNGNRCREWFHQQFKYGFNPLTIVKLVKTRGDIDMNKKLIVGILAVALLATIGIGAALDQTTTTKEDPLRGNCYGTCDGSCDRACTGDGICDGTGNTNTKGCGNGGFGPRDGTGFGCGGYRGK